MSTLITTYKEGMEDLRQDLEQTVETESGGNIVFEQSIQEELAASAVKINSLQKEFEQF